jgi:hypothetical protein
MAGPWVEISERLWDELDQREYQVMYADWFERAYNDQAHGDSKTWEALSGALFNQLKDTLVPLGVTSPNDRTWCDLVPFVGGGWMMLRARNITIREEP